MGIISNIFGRVFGSRNERLLKKLHQTVQQINQLEPAWKALKDNELQAKTEEFKVRLAQNADQAAIIPEAFATVREASRRVLNMRHFDVQLVGGLVLNQGKIAEMRTGEGKTLVATLSVYLNALSGQGVHVITVNDYLAKRDAEWMRPVYEFLGLTVGVIQAGLTPIERKQAYAADITYGTNNEFGFDYLRDNMALDVAEQVQRPLNYALVDEVDSILIDESRTPLIISGPSEESSEYYNTINQVIPYLKQGEAQDFTIDEKARQVHLTEKGHQILEERLVKVGLLKAGENLYSAEHIGLMYHVSAALRAYYLYKKDVDYIVQANKIVIVDEHTGRLMAGRRWSDGLHQAVEAKENVAVQPENQTLASITFQNYFRLYKKLSGMTGTADTEAYEFQQIYHLEVVVIPTHQPVRRKDLSDSIYLTAAEKWEAIVLSVKERQDKKQPILVGTASIENSELLSRLLQKEGISHQVLNAKKHEQEASIIAEAGRPGAVTIATNMAGRGTDIVLGGHLQKQVTESASDDTIEHQRQKWHDRYQLVVEAGGLHIIGSGRHESRRIDNQLRGRAGRQGDPGSSQFFLSLEDDLLRIFAADRLSGLMKRLGMQKGESIEHPWVTRAIQNAQRKVEAHHFDARKALLEYDDVMNEQRKTVYEQRQTILNATDISSTIRAFWQDVLSNVVAPYQLTTSAHSEWDVAGLAMQLKADFGLSLPLDVWVNEPTTLVNKIIEAALKNHEESTARLNADERKQMEKTVMLQAMDHLWKEHLNTMDHLRQSINLRAFAQQNPKQEYKREAFALFGRLLESLKYQVISTLSTVDLSALSQPSMESKALELESEYQMIGRNMPCPCGSDKKFKHCHGRLN